MKAMNVQKLPQTAPIGDMSSRQDEVLRMTEIGPVILLSHSKPSAVLISPDQWDAIADALQQLQNNHTGQNITDQNITDQAVDALAEIAALAQPLGPADLALNFNRYTNQVLNDESAE